MPRTWRKTSCLVDRQQSSPVSSHSSWNYVSTPRLRTAPATAPPLRHPYAPSRPTRPQVLSEPQDRRNIWKHKVEQMAEDVSSLKGGFESAMGRRGRRLMEERERAELFNRVDVTGEAER